MSDTACNFALTAAFNAKHDITWSFQYCLSGTPESTGGFTTFVYDASASSLSGGGIRDGLGFGPHQMSYAGVGDAILGAGLDATGAFSVAGGSFSTGMTTASANTITLRSGSSFQHQQTTLLPFEVVESSEAFKTLRFNLTNLGQTLNVHQYDYVTRSYTRIASLSTGMLFMTDKLCKIGISYSTPVTGSVGGCIFKIKDVHVQGLSA